MIARKMALYAGIAGLLVGPVAATSAQAQNAKTRLTTKITAPAPFTDKEKKQGADAHPSILQEFGGAYKVPQTDYVVRVGKKIASQSGLANADGFTVTLLNSSVSNAFAIPGGYAYITRQLVALCNSEAELAGVMGHEVGHGAARHAAGRQKQGTLAQIGAIVGTVAGLAIGNAGGLLGVVGSGLRQYSGTVAQLVALKYSRSQEEQADDLGMFYLDKAGYDSAALSSMLTSLAMQSALDAKVAGKGDSRIPEWSSTHPDPVKRVSRAAVIAKNYKANSYRNVAGHMKEIDGLLYGDDPKQGVVEGQEFIHPDLRFKFAFPNGYGLQNGEQAIAISGNGGQALFTLGAFNGDRAAYVAAALKAALGDKVAITPGPVSTTTINGIPAFYSSSTVAQQKGNVTVTVFAYEMVQGQAYHFVTLAPVGTSPFNSMYQSMSRLTTAQAAAVRPRKIDIVTVGSNDTVASLSSRMAYSSMQTERFLALNGMTAGTPLVPKSQVKIVVY